jgi:hypothetical protein
LLYVEVLCVVFFIMFWMLYLFVYNLVPCIFASNLFLQKVYDVVLLKFDNPFCIDFFFLPKESKKILTYTLLFYSFQNLVIHWATLKINNHTTNIESKFFDSLSFIFGQILVKVIWLY